MPGGGPPARSERYDGARVKKKREKKYYRERERPTEKKICYNQLLGGDQLHPMAKDVIALSSYSWSHSVLRFSGFAAFTASSKFIRNTEREREKGERGQKGERQQGGGDLPELYSLLLPE